MRNAISILVLISSSLTQLQSQSVLIGDGTPDPSALLEVKSNAQGFLLPQMTLAQINAIADPAEGLQIYNVEDNCIYIFNGTIWLSSCSLKFEDSPHLPEDGSKWVAIEDFSGEPRIEMVSIGHEGFGFIGTGRTANGEYLNDFYEYDICEETWSAIDTIPGEGFSAGFSFKANEHFYVGGGHTKNGVQNKLYQYVINEKRWIQRADFQFGERKYPVSFSINGNGYVGLGENGLNAAYDDMYKYDAQTFQWSQIADFPGEANLSLTAFVIDGYAYVGGGFRRSGERFKEFYKYDPIADQWTSIADHPHDLFNAVGFSNGRTGIVGTGADAHLDRQLFYEYSPTSDVWTPVVDFIDARLGAKGFVINNEIYVGLGTVSGPDLSDMYKLHINKSYRSIGPDREVSWTPHLKYKRIEATSAAAQGDWITLPTGLTSDQIIEANVYIDYLLDGTKIPPSYTYVGGLEFDNWIKSDGNIVIVNHRTNSAQITNRPVIVDIIYTE